MRPPRTTPPESLGPDWLEPQSPAQAHPLELLAPIGRGGMGEVWRAYDRQLRRTVAVKILPHGAGHSDRFLEEAQATGQLEHPGIVPVYGYGVLPDGRPYFTMKEIRGSTLHEVIALAHGEGREDWPLRRLVDIFRRVCEAVAYAHDRGVIHRDLKPANVMIGAFGEVWVLDWGLVHLSPDAALPVVTDATTTVSGQLVGTPRYMSPEQVDSQRDLGPPSDVFALGAILAEILTGRPAFPQSSLPELLQAIRQGEPELPRAPLALRELCARALARAPADRYPDAGALAIELGAWLDDARRREHALSLVASAEQLIPEEQALRARAAALTTEIEALAATVPPYAPLGDKRPLWALEDRLREAKAEADALQRRRIQTLQAALTHQPELEEALSALASHHRGQHEAAERARDAAAAAEAEAGLRFYDRGTHDAYLRGDGTLTLRCTHEARVTLYPLVERDRQLVPGDPIELGTAPLRAVPLPMGSYLAILQAPGRSAARYPVSIGRTQRWDSAPPDDPGGLVPLLRAGALDDDSCYIPPGWFFEGTPQRFFQGQPWARRWEDGFVVGRHPITQAEYLTFLDALVDEGREADALRYAPQERGARPDAPGPQVYGRTASGRFELRPDADGDLWDPRWPAFLVDWHSACAYAAWRAQRDGLPWQLPTERQWEKAARGVDGRSFPWGEAFDATFACIRDSHRGRPLAARVDDFEADCSVYGVRGMAGNVRDWCSDPFRVAGEDSGQRVLKGGCWFFPRTGAHTAARFGLAPTNRGDTIGFRLARPLVPSDLD
jgi:formylglycine-generating enzyme required for sulfatase activity